MTEADDNDLKRLRMRSWRRGMRELDLILGPYADAELPRLGAAERADYEALIGESDGDLYRWAAGAAGVPPRHAAAIARIRRFHCLGRVPNKPLSRS